MQAPQQQGNPLTYTGWCSEETPCFECQGQCFSNEDCFGNLVCFIRAGFSNIPSCAGSGIYGVSYCYSPSFTQEPMLEHVDECSADTPCTECQGDCNNDEDCADNLVCFARLDDGNVPGCTGTGETGTDYCIQASTLTVAPTTSPTRAPVTLPPTQAPVTLPPTEPILSFGGDCSSDDPCGLCQGMVKERKSVFCGLELHSFSNCSPLYSLSDIRRLR